MTIKAMMLVDFLDRNQDIWFQALLPNNTGIKFWKYDGKKKNDSIVIEAISSNSSFYEQEIFFEQFNTYSEKNKLNEIIAALQVIQNNMGNKMTFTIDNNGGYPPPSNFTLYGSSNSYQQFMPIVSQIYDNDIYETIVNSSIAYGSSIEDINKIISLKAIGLLKEIPSVSTK